MAERLGVALAEAGPSITLAAAAETLAFALGGLTPMPAVRNFSLCAALAILLDFLLQVRSSIHVFLEAKAKRPKLNVLQCRLKVVSLPQSIRMAYTLVCVRC